MQDNISLHVPPNTSCCSVTVPSDSLWPYRLHTPGFLVFHHLPEFAQTHVPWVGDALQPSHPLLPFTPPALNLSQHPVFFNELALCIRRPKDWSFSLSITLSNAYSGLISFRIDWFDLLAVQGLSKIFAAPQFESISSSAFVMVQLSHPYMTTGKTIALTRWTFVGRVMSLISNTWSRFLIDFLPRNKCLLISRLWASSTLILEPQNQIPKSQQA